MSSTRADEIKLDIEELNSLLSQATRQKPKDLLTLELRRLQTELGRLSEEKKPTASTTDSSVTSSATAPKCYEVKLSHYAWDQSDRFIKLYVTLKNVQSLPKEAVTCDFTERSIDLRVRGLDNRNYQLLINNLCEEIDTSKSYTKIKSDMIAVFLGKKSPKSWSHITGVEKRMKEAKALAVPEMGEDNDPSASLMSLMKKMYQDGDEDMKKTIAKAWTESQDKKAAGIADFPSL